MCGHYDHPVRALARPIAQRSQNIVTVNFRHHKIENKSAVSAFFSASVAYSPPFAVSIPVMPSSSSMGITGISCGGIVFYNQHRHFSCPWKDGE